MYYTYSFQDVNIAISHPSVGSFSMNGKGIGEISIQYANDQSTQSVGADSTVITNKILANNGTIDLKTMQNSDLDLWMRKWYRYIKTAPSSQWANTTVTIREIATGETTTCQGVSPQKGADKPYKPEAQNIEWTLLAADISQ